MKHFQDVRAIIFDLDDTLCGYWDASKVALLTTFQNHPVEGFTAEEMVQKWAAAFKQFGAGIKQTHWYPKYLISGKVTRDEQMRLMLESVGVTDQQLAEALSESYMRLRDQNLRLFPEAKSVLDILRDNYPLGVMTNGPADIQRQELQTLNLEQYFDPILIEGEMGKGKPLPEVFRHAESLMGQQPEHMLMVGNSFKHDIEPAIHAGWKTAWIRRPSDVPPSAGAAGKPEEKPDGAAEPTITIHDLRELLPHLGNFDA